MSRQCDRRAERGANERDDWQQSKHLVTTSRVLYSKKNNNNNKTVSISKVPRRLMTHQMQVGTE